MKNCSLKLITIVLIMASSCSDAKVDNYSVVYEVEMIGTWSENSHPTEFPSNAHFSPFIGLSHVESLDVLGLELTATEGVKNMAETGDNTQLEKEFDKFHNLTYSLDKVVGKSINSTGNTKAEIGVERGRHFVSIFSMLAPSPDWFVYASTNLIDVKDGEWYDEIIFYSNIYDAGTDTGTTFHSENAPLSPPVGIQELVKGPLTEGSDSVKSVAKFIFRRIK